MDLMNRSRCLVVVIIAICLGRSTAYITSDDNDI